MAIHVPGIPSAAQRVTDEANKFDGVWYKWLWTLSKWLTTLNAAIDGAGNIGIGTGTPYSNISSVKMALDISRTNFPGVVLHQPLGLSASQPSEAQVIMGGNGYYLDVAGYATQASNRIILRTGHTYAGITSGFVLTHQQKIVIGGAAEADTNATFESGGTLRVQGRRLPTAGSGLEIDYATAVGGSIAAYNRDTSSYQVLNLFARNINLGSGLGSSNLPNSYGALNIAFEGGPTGQGGITMRPVTAGAGYAMIFENSAGSVQGQIYYDGAGTSAYQTASDYRLKDVRGGIESPLRRLSELKPITFAFKADPSQTPVEGFLAHEVAAVVPKAVTGSKDAVKADGTPAIQQMDAAKLVPLLVAAMQEMAGEIAALKASRA
jgi:hypothetical protein